jgi:hypothetical protein
VLGDLFERTGLHEVLTGVVLGDELRGFFD